MSVKSFANTAGLSGQSKPPVMSGNCEPPWITRELVEETRRVWSPRYGRELSDHEVMEILNNVKRLAESLIRISKGEQ